MKNHRTQRGILATVGALATSAALVFGGAVAATAIPTIPLPPPDTTANLNITKLSMPDDGPIAPTGEIQTRPEGSDPVAGVTFSVQRVNTVDLSTNAGWVVAEGLAFDPTTAPYVSGTGTDGNAVSLGTAAYGTTDVNGVPQVSDAAGTITGGTAFQSLPIGLYLVRETNAPAGVTASAPFLVTLPITNAAGDSWNHNVQVYPKNSVTAITKTVNDAAPYTTGPDSKQQITYTIDADVPRNAGPLDEDGDPTWLDPTAYVIKDDLNDALTPTEVTVALTGTSATLVAGDYTVTPTMPGAAGAEVVVTFTPAGLIKLGDAAADAAAKVRVVITAGVATDSTASVGAISNAARLFPDEASVIDDKPLTSTGVNTNWNKVQFTKKDADGPLAGAGFQVFLNQGDAQSAAAGGSVRGAAVATSAATTGTVTIEGLRASNYANGAVQAPGAWNAGACTPNANYIIYWLTETQAPEGYEMLARPIPVVLLQDGTVEKLETNADGSVKYIQDAGTTTDCAFTTTAFSDVVNVKQNAGFQLPLTGGMGTAILTILGAGILAVVLVVARRRRNAEAAE